MGPQRGRLAQRGPSFHRKAILVLLPPLFGMSEGRSPESRPTPRMYANDCFRVELRLPNTLGGHLYKAWTGVPGGVGGEGCRRGRRRARTMERRERERERDSHHDREIDSANWVGKT